MADELPIYRLSGRWKSEHVKDYPVFLLQVYTKPNTLTMTQIENITKAIKSNGFNLDPGYDTRGAFFYFEITEEKLARRVEETFRAYGFDIEFVGASTPRFLTDEEYQAQQAKKKR